ncbi:hypothetical protein BaRGS_00028864 [Batillaria attramentaria]|uniref:Uncharacterized protein n=1 Tax=Batillaria attramentaria TaxID=370345 RepID=A0ABD0JYM7_9CAEN
MQAAQTDPRWIQEGCTGPGMEIGNPDGSHVFLGSDLKFISLVGDTFRKSFFVQAKHAGANARVSSTMALLTCMQPLSYATIYPLTGPLITVTGNDATPLYMGSAFSFLSAFTFMLYNIW